MVSRVHLPSVCVCVCVCLRVSVSVSVCWGGGRGIWGGIVIDSEDLTTITQVIFIDLATLRDQKYITLHD